MCLILFASWINYRNTKDAMRKRTSDQETPKIHTLMYEMVDRSNKNSFFKSRTKMDPNYALI